MAKYGGGDKRIDMDELREVHLRSCCDRSSVDEAKLTIIAPDAASD